MRTLGFGFIGAGEIAVASATGVANSQHARLVRVVDSRADLAEDLVQRFGGATSPSVEALLDDPLVEAVYVAAPHFLHRGLALQAALAGKHVLIEKPLGVNPDDAQTIVEACRAHDVACGVPFIVRYAPAYRLAHQLVHDGVIGTITGFRITYRGDKPQSYWDGGYSGRSPSDWRQQREKAGGGVMIMNTIHDLDALLWITGLEVEEAQGIVANVASPGDVEDLAIAILRCASGAWGSLEAAAALPGGQGPSTPWVNRIYGSTGQILLPNPWGSAPLALYTRAAGAWEERAAPAGADPRQQAINEFAGAILRGEPVPIPGEAGLTASRVLHAVYTSAASGSPVRCGQEKSLPECLQDKRREVTL